MCTVPIGGGVEHLVLHQLVVAIATAAGACRPCQTCRVQSQQSHAQPHPHVQILDSHILASPHTTPTH